MGQKEGRRIKSGHPMDAISPFIMDTRSGSSNQFNYSVNIEKCEELIKRKRAEGLKNIGMIHLFMAAYVRVIATLPGVNRYIRGQRVYARNGIAICMVVKKELSLNAPETVVKIYPNASDTLDDVYRILNEGIETNLAEGDTNNMDSFIRILTKLPRIFLRSAIGLIKFFDYFGLLPKYITDLSPFHGSIFMTNLGSLGIPPVFHHLYDFGNLPVFLAMGAKRNEYVINKEGEVERNRLIDFTVVCDERICDGHYYATAFKKFKRLLENPEQLCEAPEKVVDDIE